MIPQQGPDPESPAGELDRLLDRRAAELGIDHALLRVWRELGYVPTSATRDLFAPEELARWERIAASSGDDTDLTDLVRLLSEDLDEVLAATLAARSPEPARRFAARVIETDLLVALEEGPDRREPETLGVTLAFLLLAGWITLSTPGRCGAEPAVSAVREGIGPKCAELAAAAARLLARDPVEDLGEELLPALVLLLAGVVLRHGDGDPGFVRRYDRSRHEDTPSR
ncbi:hypothetical protein [Saccharopolyspora flava]|uniref:Uncharacterized protein n=1 Tax=Saccharopolyspora flava TaxID=95161 RepID=A0A1I6SRY4_9PSEU|nr:hypothetical protein [Saccharopolyspora flava]SFS79629.1 hypothetical protein SAMN05660874_03353 [Saccharopolyspora flava]